MNVTVSVQIQASPEVIFEWLTDLDRYKLWNDGLTKMGRRGKMHEGMIFSSASTTFGQPSEASIEVRRLVPNQEIELINNTGAVSYRAIYRLIPDEGRTEVVLWLQLEPNSRLVDMAAPMLESVTASRLQGYLETLRDLVEKGSAQAHT